MNKTLRTFAVVSAISVPMACSLAPPDHDAPAAGQPLDGDDSTTIVLPEKPIVCGGSTAEWAPLTLAWSDDDDSTIAGGASLELTNTTSTPLTVIVQSQLDGANGRWPLPPQTFKIASQQTVVAVIDPTPVAQAIGSETTPLAANVEVVVDGGRQQAEPRYLHHVQGSSYRWYSKQYLPQHNKSAFLAAAAQSQVQPTSMEADLLGDIQVVGDGHGRSQYLDIVQSSVVLGGGGGPDGPDDIDSGLPGYQAVCFWLNASMDPGGVDFADYDPGMNSTLHPANGTRVWLSVPFVGTFFGELPREGPPCAVFPALPEGFPFFMGMYFESHIGGDPTDDIMLRVYGNDTLGWPHKSYIEDWEVPRNAYFFWSQGETSVVDVATHPGNRPLANFLSVGIRELSYYEDLLGPPLPHELGPGPHTLELELLAEDCPGWPAGTSCAGSHLARVTPSDQGYRKTELIGHEIGHILQRNYHTHQPNYNPETIYDAPSADAACDGFGEGHALFSKEWATAAYMEGHASILGAFALSSSDAWRYYKNIAGSGGLYTNQVVHLSDPTGWDLLHNECSTGGTSGFGVEYDWMRFFWDYYSFASLNMPTLFNRLGAANNGMGTQNTYERIRAATPAGLERDMLDNRAFAHGVYDVP